jgi:hypothetical protein
MAVLHKASVPTTAEAVIEQLHPAKAIVGRKEQIIIKKAKIIRKKDKRREKLCTFIIKIRTLVIIHKKQSKSHIPDHNQAPHIKKGFVWRSP